MPERVTAAVENMAAAYDTDVLVRGFFLGAEATIKELIRQGLLPEQNKEAQPH